MATNEFYQSIKSMSNRLVWVYRMQRMPLLTCRDSGSEGAKSGLTGLRANLQLLRALRTVSIVRYPVSAGAMISAFMLFMLFTPNSDPTV